jgi:hypothetical protein
MILITSKYDNWLSTPKSLIIRSALSNSFGPLVGYCCWLDFSIHSIHLFEDLIGNIDQYRGFIWYGLLKGMRVYHWLHIVLAHSYYFGGNSASRDLMNPIICSGWVIAYNTYCQLDHFFYEAVIDAIIQVGPLFKFSLYVNLTWID